MVSVTEYEVRFGKHKHKKLGEAIRDTDYWTWYLGEMDKKPREEWKTSGAFVEAVRTLLKAANARTGPNPPRTLADLQYSA
jgi:hypothetical protein